VILSDQQKEPKRFFSGKPPGLAGTAESSSCVWHWNERILWSHWSRIRFLSPTSDPQAKKL